MLKYKLIYYPDHFGLSLYEYEADEAGEIVLIFEAESWEEALKVRNHFHYPKKNIQFELTPAERVICGNALYTLCVGEYALMEDEIERCIGKSKQEVLDLMHRMLQKNQERK